ncbi:hypothetical protein BS17DRAFT_869845, partial [Gyrodon lividus]
LFGTKLRDGRGMKTSGCGNRMTRITRVKHSNDGILLDSRDAKYVWLSFIILLTLLAPMPHLFIIWIYLVSPTCSNESINMSLMQVLLMSTINSAG